MQTSSCRHIQGQQRNLQMNDMEPEEAGQVVLPQGLVPYDRHRIYDGRTALDAQFAMLADLNGWSDAEKASYLPRN